MFVRPVHVHNSTYFISSLILLLLPAFAVVSRRGLPQPSCKHVDGGARTFGHGDLLPSVRSLLRLDSSGRRAGSPSG
jgi:hypothetical protein